MQGYDPMKKYLLVPVICLLLASTSHAQDVAEGVGFRLIQMQDPISLDTMNATVFYPSEVKGGFSTKGLYQIDATENSSIRQGSYPLVLLSHGGRGTMFGHHDMATFLAHRGFVVAAIEHPGDNSRDQRARGTDRILIGRAHQLSGLLTHLLNNTDFRASINPEKIVVAGFSAGGYTALLMVGAQPDFELLKGFCQRNPSDPGFCRGYPHPRIALSTPPLTTTADPRIRAAFAMAPIGILFNDAGLAKIKVPVFLYAAASDQVLIPSENAERIRPMLRTLKDYRVIPNAGHFIFLAPCSPAQNSQIPDLCTDPPGVDRAAIHANVNREILDFFNWTLGPE